MSTFQSCLFGGTLLFAGLSVHAQEFVPTGGVDCSGGESFSYFGAGYDFVSAPGSYCGYLGYGPGLVPYCNFAYEDAFGSVYLFGGDVSWSPTDGDVGVISSASFDDCVEFVQARLVANFTVSAAARFRVRYDDERGGGSCRLQLTALDAGQLLLDVRELGVFESRLDGTNVYEVFVDCDSSGVDGGAASIEFELLPAASCPADLDGDGDLTLFDFLAFQNLFDAGDPAADFDGDGMLTIFDFLEFQNQFDAGCP
ncbi:MAG: GC-type dockerin domain-anchored protein [Planctomycetota bacterium]